MNIDTLLAESAIVKTITGYMNAVDTGRWDDVSAFFKNDVFVDYSSIPGAPTAFTASKRDVIARWEERFRKEIAYQHHLSNLEVLVTGDLATCFGNNRGDHLLEDTEGRVVLWQIGVRLNWTLQRAVYGAWEIASVTAEYLWDRREQFNGLKGASVT
ncbi:nuclear transport factor 2 family protein [Burkholderia cenocepacia]|nr:nuclear transport factor 2 family protein [Burkholderia cenocepacia]MCW3701500.1 nuclear transport factor 2 family protein [Burkholderia cenocepacia]MCW3709516.1 nuclear transport factor 2 family protein [Burkholderia cenocepacia]MCW3733554.1 nuclear transport factor 2 family protein [Burkholderia cenocepacia]OQD24964.1 hypothetical protein UE98_11465 [Burkholderia cenocepacia]